MESPSIEARWFKCLETLDLEQIDEFKMKFKNTSNPREMVKKCKKIRFEEKLYLFYIKARIRSR